MKKTFAIIGSLLIAAGLKAQTIPTVRKETAPPVKKEQTPVSDTAIVKGDKNATDTHIKNTTGTIKETNSRFKKTNTTIKQTGNTLKLKNELQLKEFKETNDTTSKAIKITGAKAMKDVPALKKTNLK
ncbi:MAG TPA: hypothetical protein PLU11_07890 [Chitinophagaceae bacterium]|nr:hypothetical protein [Chitinophagaceae bacterium]HPH30796.1 hypothetical protein [Chitinophagaceae bacterium]HPN59077.1 hypothetical protein [Chitinophagaceae bacterium]